MSHFSFLKRECAIEPLRYRGPSAPQMLLYATTS